MKRHWLRGLNSALNTRVNTSSSERYTLAMQQMQIVHNVPLQANTSCRRQCPWQAMACDQACSCMPMCCIFAIALQGMSVSCILTFQICDRGTGCSYVMVCALPRCHVLDDVQKPPMDTKALQHLPRQSIRYNVGCFPEVHEKTIQLGRHTSLWPCLSLLFDLYLEDKDIVSHAMVDLTNTERLL